MNKEIVKGYEGCAEQWKVKLALARIRAFGFRQDQWADILQKLMMQISGFRFSVDRSGGRTEAQVLYGMINNHLRSLIRCERRQRKHLERFCDHIGLTAANADQHPRFVAEDDTEMRLDVQEALAALPQKERDICQRLMGGDSVTQIAADLGVGWHVVQRVIARLRKHFANLELDAWLAN